MYRTLGLQSEVWAQGMPKMNCWSMDIKYRNFYFYVFNLFPPYLCMFYNVQSTLLWYYLKLTVYKQTYLMDFKTTHLKVTK